ncbi:hypothetical protein L917_05757 [Phytophthora nicotianae]|uniref:Uncharacterized protein n=1 Tax=Phytophthora nicotianae TaxID=4792 RepID=W2LJN5_PHYNI|nr:hypothetical protein L917_05757 [Phytophthora nicotianae]
MSRSTARWRSRYSRGLHSEGPLTTGPTSYILQARARLADVGVPCLEWDWNEGNVKVPRCGPPRGEDLWTGKELQGRGETVEKRLSRIHDPDTKEEDRDSLVEKQGILSPDYRENGSAESNSKSLGNGTPKRGKRVPRARYELSWVVRRGTR